MNSVVFNSKFDEVARYFAVAGIFFIPLSLSLSNLILVALALMMLGGNLKEKFKFIASYQSVFYALLFLLMIEVGALYSIGGSKQSYGDVVKYGHKLLVFVLLIPLFVEPIWRKRAINAVIVATFLVILFRYLSLFPTRSIADFFSVRKFHVLYGSIEFSILCAIVAFILIHRIFNRQGLLIVNSLGILIMSYYLLFTNIQRSGVVIIILLVGLLLCQRFKRGLLAAIVITPLLAFLVYNISPIMKQRSAVAKQDIQAYEQGNPNTSMGLRTYHAKISWALIKQHPIFGTGTGSYLVDYLAEVKKQKIVPTEVLTNPHNNYLMIAVETGLVGLILFILWLVSQWIDTRKLLNDEKYLAQGVIVTYAVANFFTVALYLHFSGEMYVALMAVLLAARKPKEIGNDRKI